MREELKSLEEAYNECAAAEGGTPGAIQGFTRPDNRKLTEIRAWIDDQLAHIPDPIERSIWLDGARAMLAKCREQDRAWMEEFNATK